MRTLVAALAGIAVLAPAGAAAQGDCFPAPDSPEARTLATFSVPLAFAAARPPATLQPGHVVLALEGATLPNVDDATATPTTCRPGKGPENTDLLFGFLRPRARLGLPGGFGLELSWVPPVRLNGVRANLFGLALDRTFPLGAGPLTLGLRGHATLGQVRGPITCPDEALADPVSECFNGERSDDRYRPNVFGVEAAVGWQAATAFQLYAGGGYNRLQPRFQVHFVNQAGQLDNRRVEVDLNRGVLFGGAVWRAAPRLGLAGELYGAPADALTVRFMLQTSVRP